MSDHQSQGFDAGPLPPQRSGEDLRPHVTYVHGHHWRNRHDEADGAKLGMWLFLSTELLLFAGFFCAYSAFRLMYPENWHEASRYYLDWQIGFINTCVLLLSSWTIVMAIRSIQLDKKWPAFIWLGITNACAVFFLVAKIALEYIPKWDKGALPGKFFNYPNPGPADPKVNVDSVTLPEPAGPIADAGTRLMDGAVDAAAGVLNTVPNAPEMIAAAAKGDGAHAHDPMPHDHIFMSVYWISTATHGLHVLIGVLMISWLMVRVARDQYGPRRFAMVENVGLYWHVVDLIWIFLFPLLYLV
ncbi:MAG: hypothetical protein Tsb0013_21620 [Phycisphaerales bacterium]